MKMHDHHCSKAEPRTFLHELLGLLGDDKINLETFWRLMNEGGLTDNDIDHYCEKYGGWTPDLEEVR